jgi:Holliday junction DNA helicase RuvB
MKKDNFLQESPVRPEFFKDDSQDMALRPRSLAEFVGQKGMKDNLNVFITAAKKRGESLDHVFLIGPAGLGKTTMAQIIANEMEGGFVQTTAPALEKPKDLVGFLTNLKKGDVFFIDEIHSLKPAIEELLYIAMEDYGIDWVVGQGPMARTIRIAIKPFTLIGATTKAGVVSSPLISRFSIPCRFSFYEQEDLESIVRRSAGLLNIKIDNDAAALLANSSRGTPRVVNRLLRRMRDFSQFEGESSITLQVVRTGLSRLEIDELGLEKQDREILKIIIERYKGGPVGAETLAISIGESIETLEDYYEPYLIQAGLLQRTPRGRVVTNLTYGHLGIASNSDSNGFLFNS